MASNTRGLKRRRTSTSNDAYELLYWPGIPGRGEFVRLAFEATETPYTDVSNASKDGVKQIISFINPGAKDDAATDEYNPPPLAPPILRHGSLCLSQMPNILMYLGPKLGLVPTQEEDPEGMYHVNELALTAIDGFSNEVHDVHHSVAVSEYYEDQKAEAKRRADEYRKKRLPKFLGHFERVLGSKSSGGEWLYGGQMTYADLVLFQGLDGVIFAFPKATQKLKESGKYEKVIALYERVKALDNIKEYLVSDRRLKYSRGIWRHYPELDE